MYFEVRRRLSGNVDPNSHVHGHLGQIRHLHVFIRE